MGGRHVARLTSGLLRAQLVAAMAERCRVGLLATTALLLGGDHAQLEVRVGPAARLDLFDVAGTVAYHGRGASAAWHVRCVLEAGAVLTYAGEPFVVADGADVTRRLDLELGTDAAVALRDTLVLGRSGQVGGQVRSITSVHRGGRPVLLEDQRLDPDRLRTAPGMLGVHRVLDTLTWLGRAVPAPCDATTYALVDGAGTLVRWLGTSLATSPLHAVEVARTVVRAAPAPDGVPQPTASTT